MIQNGLTAVAFRWSITACRNARKSWHPWRDKWMKPAFRLRLAIPILAFAFPVAVRADLNQTNVLTAGNTINLDTGAVGASGGDIQWNSSGITPQGSATALHIYSNWPLAQFETISIIVVSGLPGYSNATIPTAELGVGNVFGVHTNSGHWDKVIVTATTASISVRLVCPFGRHA
jgi:hypothetical protein